MLHAFLATYDNAGNLTNLAALATRAAERASDWFRKAKSFNVLRLRSSLGALPGLVTSIGSIRMKVAVHDRGSGMLTDVFAGPDDGGESLQQWKPKPPPWPQITTFVRKASNTLTSGYYDGYVQIYDPATDTWSDGERVWLEDANG
jgi:hypothetical protein